MYKKEKILLYSSVILLILAILACATQMPLPVYKKSHDFQIGLSSWKYTNNFKVEQETKFNYNNNNELVSIEFFVEGKPYYINSYLKYITINDSLGNKIKYRYCARRAYYNRMSVKGWEDSTSIIIINNEIKIKSMVTMDGTGKLKYRDEYEYDKIGRKTKAARIFSDNTIIKHEYSYENENNLGIVSKEYYFEIPYIYYNIDEYAEWCSIASKNIQPIKTDNY